MNKALSSTPEKDFVITQDDMNQCLGSTELKPCPFCGRRAISVGKINRETNIIGYTVMCSDWHCGATIHYNAENTEAGQKKARTGAIERWNNRVAPTISE